MVSLSTELKHTIKRRVDAAGPAEILMISSVLCAQETLIAQAASARTMPAGLAADAAIRPQFIKLSHEGLELDEDADDWDAVRDTSTGLISARKPAPCGRVDWKKAMAAAAATTLCGWSDWRAPTVREQLSLVDYERHAPAIDTRFFNSESDWFWTSTPAAYSPSGVAWGVGFDGGYAGWGGRGYDGFVRAVRAGQ